MTASFKTLQQKSVEVSLFQDNVAAALRQLSNDIEKLKSLIPSLSGSGGIGVTTKGPGDANGVIGKATSVVVSGSSSSQGGGDPNAPYVIVSATPSLPHARVIEGGANVTVTDNGTSLSIAAASGQSLSAGSGISISSNTVTNTAPGDVGAAYVTLANTASLSNERALVAGSGINISDAGANSSVTVGLTGFTGGGQKFTIPSMFSWVVSTASLPARAGQGNGTAPKGGGGEALVIGNKIYLFGFATGSTVNGEPGRIFSASVNAPEEVSDTGRSQSPDNLNFCNRNALFVINDKVYHMGSPSSHIATHLHSASLSDPLTWGSASLSQRFDWSFASVHIIGDKLYAFGASIGTSKTNTIWSASIATPTQWSDTGKQITTSGTNGTAACFDEHSTFIFKGKIFCVGGFNLSSVTNRICVADYDTPLVWSTAFCGPQQISMTPLALEDKMYLIGGENGPAFGSVGNIWQSTDGLNWSPPVPETNAGSSGWTLGLSALPISASMGALAIVSGTIYMYGPATGSNRQGSQVILKTAVQHSASTTVNLPTYPTGCVGIYQGNPGHDTNFPTFLSSQYRLGGIPASRFYSTASLNTSL